MSKEETRLSQLNRIIHEPARLAILSVLSACKNADFLFLQRSTGLTSGNLSVQITRLEEAGMIFVEKRFEGRKPLTTASLTPTGRTEITSYWKAMDQLRNGSYDDGRPTRKPA